MKRDGRSFDHQTLEAITADGGRARAGRRGSILGHRVLRFSRTTIYKWLAAAAKPGIGLKALVSRPAPGRPRTLSPRQEQQVLPLINGRDPRQYGLDFGLWTRSVVASLIERKFGVRLGLTAVGELLAKLGLTPQKPLQRAYQRDPEGDREMAARNISGHRAAGASGRRRGLFLGRVGISRGHRARQTWGVKGQTPVVERPGQRQSISAASAVNSKGAFWYCTYQGGLDAELFVVLMRRMMRHRTKPVHLVVDGLPAHKTALVKAYVASTDGLLTLHFLPGYAPELNPDELVWSHVKRTGVARTPLRKGEKLKDKVEAQLAALKKTPRLVRSFFMAPSVVYITDW